MMIFQKIASPIAAVALVAPAAASAQAPTPTTLGTTTEVTIAGAAGGWTAWSEKQGAAFALAVRDPQGTLTHPSGATRRVPFDLDLGTDAAGKVVAAYSRCTTEPRRTGGVAASGPQYDSGAGCRIVILDLASGTERTLKLASGDASEVLPSVGGSKVAYIAVHKASKDRKRAFLAIRPIASTTAKTLRSDARVVSSDPGSAQGPTTVDTDGKRVASLWRSMDNQFHEFDTELYAGSVSGGSQVNVDGASNTDYCNFDTLAGATVSGSQVLYAEYVSDSNSGFALERRPATGASKSEFAVSDSRPADGFPLVTSSAVDGNRVVVATSAVSAGESVGATTVAEYPLGTFTKKAPKILC